MNNFILTVLTLLGLMSDLIELTYEAGVFTRRHVLPSLVWVYVYVTVTFENITTMDMDLNIQTPQSPRLGFG